MALDTVQDYLTRARTILQDEVEPYRYSDVDLVEALNMALMEVRRLRPEAVASSLNTAFPEYSAGSLATAVEMDVQLRSALVYYICGHVHLRDSEVEEGSRAASFLNKFIAQMLTIQS